MPAPLSPDELLRYSRHTLLPDFGAKGQARLKAGRVLMVGAGGLGSPAALYLAAAGVGTLGLVDFDDVDVTNLQRQVLYGTEDVGKPKLDVAAARLRDVNPHVAIELHREAFGVENAMRLVTAYDVIVDGTDNFATRYLVNDACVMAGGPNVYGSVFRFEGQASVFATNGGPCYRCLHPEPPPAGLIPKLCGGRRAGRASRHHRRNPGDRSHQTAGRHRRAARRETVALTMRCACGSAEIALPRDPECPVCGDAPTIREVGVPRMCLGDAVVERPPATTSSDG